MLSYHPKTRWERLWPALDQIDHPMPTVRNIAVDLIRDILPADLSFAAFLREELFWLEVRVPWWQSRADRLVHCYGDLLSQAGREFCLHLSGQREDPTEADTQTLIDLETWIYGVPV